MPVMIQIRNVPDDIHRTLRERAAAESLSLSDYMLKLVRREVAQPTLKQALARLAARPPLDVDIDWAAAVRAERDSR